MNWLLCQTNLVEKDTILHFSKTWVVLLLLLEGFVRAYCFFEHCLNSLWGTSLWTLEINDTELWEVFTKLGLRVQTSQVRTDHSDWQWFRVTRVTNDQNGNFVHQTDKCSKDILSQWKVYRNSFCRYLQSLNIISLLILHNFFNIIFEL